MGFFENGFRFLKGIEVDWPRPAQPGRPRWPKRRGRGTGSGKGSGNHDGLLVVEVRSFHPDGTNASPDNAVTAVAKFVIMPSSKPEWKSPWTRSPSEPIEESKTLNPNGGKTNGLFSLSWSCVKGAFPKKPSRRGKAPTPANRTVLPSTNAPRTTKSELYFRNCISLTNRVKFDLLKK